MKPVLVVAALMSAIVAVSAPWAAPRVAGLLLAVVASAYVVQRLHGVVARLPVADDRRLVTTPRPRRGAPADLTLLTNELQRARPSQPLSPAVTTCVRDLAAARLREHHGLDVRDPFTHDEIRARVSGDLWSLLVRTAPGERVVRLQNRSLPTLIDEVEHL
jgi:hypothetical protein